MVASPNKLKSIGRIFFWGISSAFSYQPEQSNQSFQRKIALRLKKPLETHFVTCFLEHIYTKKNISSYALTAQELFDICVEFVKGNDAISLRIF